MKPSPPQILLAASMALASCGGCANDVAEPQPPLLPAPIAQAAAAASSPAAKPSAHEARLAAQDAALVANLRGQLVRRQMPPSKYLQGRRVVAWAYLPPGYDSSTQRYPVAYLLHGAPGSVRDPFVNAQAHRVAERLIVSRQIQPLILVGWDGFGPRGFEDATDFLDRKDGRYQMESFVTRELVPFIDGALRTQARASGRALIGFSAGGYGAANIGFRHPDLFGVIASHAGFFDPGDDPRNIARILGPRASNAALWDANSPLLRARAVSKGARLHFYMDCGRSDPLLSEFRKMQAELQARGADFEAQVVDGAHDWAFLSRHYADSMRFCDRRFHEMTGQNP